MENEKERKECTHPMSEFYIYEDEVPANTRVSTMEDCKDCYGLEFEHNENCPVVDSLCETKFCLITEWSIEPVEPMKMPHPNPDE